MHTPHFHVHRTDLKRLKYPALLFLYLCLIAALFALASRFLSKHIAKALDEAPEQTTLRIDQAAYERISARLGIAGTTTPQHPTVTPQ
jgi:hypothetical protein